MKKGFVLCDPFDFLEIEISSGAVFSQTSAHFKNSRFSANLSLKNPKKVQFNNYFPIHLDSINVWFSNYEARTSLSSFYGKLLE